MATLTGIYVNQGPSCSRSNNDINYHIMCGEDPGSIFLSFSPLWRVGFGRCDSTGFFHLVGHSPNIRLVVKSPPAWRCGCNKQNWSLICLFCGFSWACMVSGPPLLHWLHCSCLSALQCLLGPHLPIKEKPKGFSPKPVFPQISARPTLPLPPSP